jgi:predicted dehydrogenase
MIKYRAAIVGARRGLHHARAYEGIAHMQVVALCEQDPERLRQGLAQLDHAAHGYSDYGQMLTTEKPDIVHVVTAPTIPRAQWIEPAAAAGVRALVIEKPIGLRPSEVEAVANAVAQSDMKVLVNHQRRYMPFIQRWEELQRSPTPPGGVQFVRASTEGPLMDMATHLMDLALWAVGDVAPEAVWATAEGGADYGQPAFQCPDAMMATITFPGGVRLLFESVESALGTRNFRGCNGRCNMDLWTDRGRFWWRQFCLSGHQVAGAAWPFLEATNMEADDPPAQRRFTEAIATWLEDESQPHRCRFELAKLGQDILFTAYRSALLGKRLQWPSPLSDAEWEQLRCRLTGQPADTPETAKDDAGGSA